MAGAKMKKFCSIDPRSQNNNSKDGMSLTVRLKLLGGMETRRNKNQIKLPSHFLPPFQETK